MTHLRSRLTRRRVLAIVLLAVALQVHAQSTGNMSPTTNTVNTPRPFDPGQNTTNPSAFAVQSQNPFLGSIPTGTAVPGVVALSLHDAVARGLQANLGFIDSQQEDVQSRAARVRALSALLPQLAAESTQEFRNLVSNTLGVQKFGFPNLIPPFNDETAHITLQQKVFDLQTLHEVKAASQDLQASAAAMADARNVVVLAAVSSYLLAAASQVRLETTRAELTTAVAVDTLLHKRIDHELSPEIDGIRADVARRSAELRVALAETTFEKDKLSLARVIGLPIEQQFSLSDHLAYSPGPVASLQDLVASALAVRHDLRAAQARVEAAEQMVKAQEAQRLPSADIRAIAGETGVNYGHAYGDWQVVGRISVPLFTGGRIESDVTTAQALLIRRRAELADVSARAVYDVRTAVLDLAAGATSVDVAAGNQALAQEGLRQAQSRFDVGVSDTVDLIQAQQAVAEAEDNHVASIYAHTLAKLMLIRATGTAEQDYPTYIGVQ